MSFKKSLKKVLPNGLFNTAVIPYHWSRALIANVANGMPAHGLTVIAVTGTNGKTTTSNMIASILNQAGCKVGLLSSAVVQIGDDVRESELELTTADVFVVQKLFKEMKDAGVTHVVLEASSHSIVQSRTLGIPITGAVFTNLTQDHLDYHKTMTKYGAAKRKLLRRAKNFCVLNADDEWYDFMRKGVFAEVVTYGISRESQFRASELKFATTGSSCKISSPHQEDFMLKLNIAGEYNVQNALAAVAAASQLDITRKNIKIGLEKMRNVPGRMESVDKGQPFSVIIDHAHTPDALENLLSNLKKISSGKLITVIGADGERDASKRIPLGKITANYSDQIVVTDQEPYGDDPAPIRDQVIRGIKSKHNHNFKEIPDRTEAIAAALKIAKKGDVVAVTGVGNQKYRGMKEGKVEWSERKVVGEQLKKLHR